MFSQPTKLGWIAAITLLLATPLSCITPHHGNVSHNQSADLAVSCGKDFEMSHESFLMLSCTFENRSRDWLAVEVESVSARAGEGKAALTVSSPHDIEDYKAAMSAKTNDSSQNVAWALGGLIVVGALASGGGDSATGTMGTAAALGATTVMVGNDEVRKSNNLQYGGEHILAESYRIPEGQYVRKKILLEGDANGLEAIDLKICTRLPTQECLTIAMTIPSHNVRTRSGQLQYQ